MQACGAAGLRALSRSPSLSVSKTPKPSAPLGPAPTSVALNPWYSARHPPVSRICLIIVGVLASPCITEMRTRSVSSGCVISVAKKSVA